ncbi:hypothetical protein JTB14_023375 [Gonioctena quinquepunctata]|nr:hypothetical protein JTB14_023375 [Gonioctena quinquepunctata]
MESENPLETGAEKILKQKGIPVYKPEDIIGLEKKVFEKVEVIGYKNKPLPLDETHPNWHDRKLLSYKDSNVLLEGLSQAKVITNTVEVKQGLPESITLKEVSTNIHKATENIILNSQLLDAEQKKLPKRNKLIISKLLKLIESTSDHQLVKERYLFEDLLFSFPVERNGQLLQLELSGDFVLTSSKALSPITQEKTENLELPNIPPLILSN